MKDITSRHLDRVRAAAEAHRQLRARLADVVAHLETWRRRSPRIEDLRDAASTLGTFRHHLLSHFAWEEHGGYMEPVVRHAPDRADAVAALVLEHQDLRDRSEAVYRDLVAAAFGEKGDAEGLASRLEDLVSRIHRHEERENALVQDVFYREAEDGVAD